MNKYYKCIKCYKTYPFKKDILTCTNHSQYYSFLTLFYDYKNIKFSSDLGASWKKYIDLLPIDEIKINFDEQKTPLIKLNRFSLKYGFTNLYVKDESKNPTGSFKDKENLIAINKALEWDIDELFVVSSGNAAVSTAAYAQKAGIKCVCLVSSKLSIGKRLLIGLYNGILKESVGSYEQIYRKTIDSINPVWNCTPGINPIKEEGAKIIGFEIWEDIGVPDAIIVPCGNGTLLFGIYKAFKELMFLGLIKKLPKMIGVQIKNASPLKTAYEQKKDYTILKQIPSSLAEGIIAKESYSSPKVMYALSDTNGEIMEVDDNEIKTALKEIVKMESILPEPTSAVVFAAVKKIEMNKQNKIVLIQTAGGIKNLKEIVQTLIN